MAGLSYADLIRRGCSLKDVCEAFGILKDFPEDIIKSAETTVKYDGYLKKTAQQIEKAKKLESKTIPADLNYDEIKGLRLEAREQLKRVRPLTLGQAGRIYGAATGIPFTVFTASFRSGLPSSSASACAYSFFLRS